MTTPALETKRKYLCGDYIAWQHAPVSVEAAGCRWLLACDGSQYVAWRSDEPAADPPEGPLSKFKVWLELDIENPIATSVDAIKKWAGEPMWSRTCPACSGTGRDPYTECKRCDGDGTVECECSDCGYEHWKKCWDCGGDGRVTADADAKCERCGGDGADRGPTPSEPYETGRICGVNINRKRLARILDVVTGPCVVGVYPENTVGMSRSALVLRGDGWQAALMPVLHEPVSEWAPGEVRP